MRQKKEEKTALARFVRPIVFGAAAGALVCFLLLLLMAAVLVIRDIPKTAVTPMAFVAAAFGALAGGLLCAVIAREKGWLLGAACGAVLFVLVLLGGWVFLHQLRPAGLLIKAALLIGCGAVGGILGVNLRR